MRKIRAPYVIYGCKIWKRNKSAWGMPWLPETTKDVVSCEKLR